MPRAQTEKIGGHAGGAWFLPVLSWGPMRAVHVPLGARSYRVDIGSPQIEAVADTLVEALPGATGVGLLVDGGLAARSTRLAALRVALAKRFENLAERVLPGGEACKNLTELGKTLDWAAGLGLDRGAAFIAVGGGAVTDHVGFAAATYLRGIRFASCPTTVLSMVDASVGGKTGINLSAGKNLVGAFHQPQAVVADFGFLASLSPREKRAGLAEVVKAGLIADAGLFDELVAASESHGEDVPDAALEQLVTASVQIKADVVVDDEKEKGRRAILNFGHTLGHALEAESKFGLLHGEAVSLGMVAALKIGADLGVNSPDLVERTGQTLQRFGLPVDVNGRFDDGAMERLLVDKKRQGDAVNFILVPKPGTAEIRSLGFDQLRSLVKSLFA